MDGIDMHPHTTIYTISVVTPGANTRTSHLIRNTIVCPNQNAYCYSHYQVLGSQSHLNRMIEHDLDEALATAFVIGHHNDILTHLTTSIQLPGTNKINAVHAEC